MANHFPSPDLKRKYNPPPLWFKVLARVAGSFNRGIFHRYPLADRADGLGLQPLLIISAGRSGTTLLRSMLVASGKIAIPPETQIFHKLAVKFMSMQGLGWPDLCRVIISSFESQRFFDKWDTILVPAYLQALNLPESERSLARIIDIVFKTYADQNFPEAVTWGEQSPSHALYLPWILPIFPRAKFLHLVRDGRDVIASWLETFGPLALEDGTYRWIQSIKNVQALRKNIGPNQLLEIRYEELVAHPAEVLELISGHMGIEYTAKMLDYWKLPSTLEYKYQVHHRNLNKPVFTSSVGKWKERLTQEQQIYVMSKISNLLETLGYTL